MEDLKEIFSFGDDKAKEFIVREMKLIKKFKISFEYLAKTLIPQKLKKDLGKMDWSEGKNYDWLLIKTNTTEILIRKYENHFTFYCKTIKNLSSDWKEKRFSCFTFNTNRDKLSDEDSDARIDDRFYDLNKHIPRLIEVIEENRVHWLWNSVSYPREDFIEFKQGLDFETIYSIDTLLFACDELFSKHFEIFAQTEGLQRLNAFKEGDVLHTDFYGDVTIEDISIELKDEYYHAVGLGVINAKGEKNFRDVYYLCRWEYDSFFKERAKPII